MSAEQIQPIAPSKRTAIVDMLRGWALLGVCLMNYISFYDTGWVFDKTYKPDTLTIFLQYFIRIFFAGKSWTMLSMLFGYGFAVLIRNVSAKGYNPIKFFSVRMFWLLVIGMINTAFWWGDILKNYAVMGLILLLFYKIKPKTAFIICVVLLMLIPAAPPLLSHIKSGAETYFESIIPLYHSARLIDNLKFNFLGTWYREVTNINYFTEQLVMLLCVLLGYILQRISFFENLAANKKLVKRTFWYTLGLGVVFQAYYFIYNKQKWGHYNPHYLAILSVMIFITAALCWLYVNGKLTGFFSAMENIGKMTLTNYIVQNIISFVFFGGVGLNLNTTMSYWFYVALALSVYVAQVYFSKWWLSRYNYGFFEWIWRQLSYGKQLPLKKIKQL